ncbi:MAG: DUF2939 domain-containing protein [Pseudomonadota bacterium]
MRKRWIFAGVCALTLAAGAYVAGPLSAAYAVVSAVKTADTKTLQARVNWPSVRRTLKRSIVRNAELRPAALKAGRAIRPSLWQRVKYAFGASMIDRFVETYITPDGLPKLYATRERWERAKPAVAMDWTARLQKFAARLKRAEFRDWTTFEIEMRDRHRMDRHIISTFQLEGFLWRLTALRVLTPPGTLATPTSRTVRASL